MAPRAALDRRGSRGPQAGCPLSWRTVLALALAFFAGCQSVDLDRGKDFLGIGDWTRALSSFEDAVEAAPLDVEARLGLARARLGLAREHAEIGVDSAGEWLAAARDFDIAARLDTTLDISGDRADALFEAALWWQRKGQTGLAAWSARRAILADSLHAPAAQLLGNLATSEGRGAEAQHWFLRAIEADSTFAPAYASLGELAVRERDFEGAALYWMDGSRYDTGSIWFRAHLDQIRDSLGWDSLP